MADDESNGDQSTEGKWEKHEDDEGNAYYYHTGTEVTTWDKPDDFVDDKDGNENDAGDGLPDTDEPLPSSPIGGADDDGGDDDDDAANEDANEASSEKKTNVWEKHETDDGTEYYYNTATEETTWDRPPDFQEGKKSTNEEISDNPKTEDDVEMKDASEITDVDIKSSSGAWEKLTDDEGREYYYNSVTEVTQWDKPDDFTDDADNDSADQKKVDENSSSPRRNQWERLKDDEGREYFYNATTDETQWEKPDDYIEPSENDLSLVNEETAQPSENKGEWEKLTDEEGREYYYNATTDVTQWEKPADYVETNGATSVSARSPRPVKGSPEAYGKGQWEKLTDENGQEYYYNSATEVTQWEIPGDFSSHDNDNEFSSSPKVTTAAEEEAPGKGQWEKYKDDEGREYFYNETTGETQWEAPEGFVEADEDEKKVDDNSEFQPSPTRSPSPVSDEEEKREGQIKEEPKPEPVEEIDPVVKRIRDAEEALSKPDSVLEPGCTANVLDVVASQDGNPEKAILALIDNFQGETAICGTLAKWLADLRSASSNNSDVNEVVGTSAKSVADEIRDTMQDVVGLIAKERFSKAGGDSILNLSKSEAAFLEDMIESKRWRKLLIDLSASNKDSALLMYCVRAISKRGYHRELVKRMNPSEYFSVFNAMLQSELSVVGKTAVSASSDVDTSIGLDELVNDLRRTCTATAFTYLYSIEVLRHLVEIAKKQAESSPGADPSRFRRAIRKWERLSQDLDCAMVDPSSSSATAGSSPLFRKRRLEVALTISELHQRQRRRLQPSSDQDVVLVSDETDQQKTMETGLLNFLRRYSVGTQIDDHVLDALLPSGLNMQESSEAAGELLISYPLAVRALVSHMFKTVGTTRVPASTKSKCARLVALATIASRKKALSEIGERMLQEEDAPDEVSLTRMLVQGCQLCEEVALMASFAVTADGGQKGKPLSQGQQLCNLALKCPMVAQGVMIWAHELIKTNEFTTTATYPTFSPSILSLIRIVALRHPCTRLEATDIAYTFLRHSISSDISYKKINEIKEQSLRLLLFLLVNGEALSVLRTMTSRLQSGTIKLDGSLLRYFIGGLLQVVKQPYSLPFVRLCGALLKTPSCIEAVRSTSYFGQQNQERLEALLSSFKESCSPKLGTATKSDIALVTFLVKTYKSTS